MNNVIEHHGVKGQKWGVRRNRKLPFGQLSDAKVGAKRALNSALPYVVQKHISKGLTKEQYKSARSSKADKSKIDRFARKHTTNVLTTATATALSIGIISAKNKINPISAAKKVILNKAMTKYNDIQFAKQAASLATSIGKKVMKEAGYRVANPGFSHLSKAAGAAARAATNGALRITG